MQLCKVPKNIGIFLVRAYQVTLSPVLGGQCRFSPSCSEFALECVEKHGICRGGVLAAKRIARCNPLGDYGYDPVP